jgi:hypothetical protein
MACEIYRFDFSPPWPPLSPSCKLYEPVAGLEAYGLASGS